jgi:hypothetical protein
MSFSLFRDPFFGPLFRQGFPSFNEASGVATGTPVFPVDLLETSKNYVIKAGKYHSDTRVGGLKIPKKPVSCSLRPDSLERQDPMLTFLPSNATKTSPATPKTTSPSNRMKAGS